LPEGHTVHRLADAFTAHFVGNVLHASSPQGRFTDGAGTIDGRRLLKAEAWGKQMFLLFEADLWLRVHLGMYGMWRFAGPGLAGIGRRTKGGPRTGDNETGDDETDEDGRPFPRGAVRLRLASPTHIGDLSGPTTCALQHPAEKQAATAEIGPDPLRPGARPARAWAVISKSKQPIGQLPMRQEIIGGIGNIYRAELLFGARIDPFRPAAPSPARNSTRSGAMPAPSCGTASATASSSPPAPRTARSRPRSSAAACAATPAPTSPSAMANPARSARLAKCQTG